MCSRESSRDTRDRGMTLVELLVTVTILGVIMSSLAAAVIVMLRAEAPTRDRIAESKDVTFLQAWIPTDLASAVSRNVDPTYQPAEKAPLPGTNVITITRPDLSNPSSTSYVTISYRYVQAGDEWQLRRYQILNPTSTTPVVTQVGVAHELAAPPVGWTAAQTPSHAVRVTARNQVVLRPIGEDIDVTFASGDVFTTGGAGLSSEDQLPTNYSGGIVDPSAPPSRCGGTVTIVLDTSGSIPSQNGQTALVNAALGFIDAYTGTPTFMRIVGFDISAYSYYPTTAGQYVNILNPSSALTAMRNKVDAQDTSSGRWGNGTNWEDGLWQAFRTNSGTAFSQLPELVVFISDGEPNRNRTNSPTDGDTRYNSTDLSRAVTAADYGRGTGARIVGVLVGNDASTTNQDRMRSVVGPVTWNGTGPSNLGNASAADFFLPSNSASFSQLGNVLRAISAAQCGGTVTVQKRLESNGVVSEATGTWNYTTDVGVRELDLSSASSITFDYTFPTGTTSRAVSIIETPVAGYVFVRAECTSGGVALPASRISSPSDGTPGVVVTLTPDEAVSCLMISRPA
ncbi:MAG: prepilin-type N-terminal cleavage/methylation domain-containing protein [Ilumatobacteraceae bacterium]